MPLRAVTFDFHNTLAICDEWFELEVRTLVPRFLDWYESRTSNLLDLDHRERAQHTYRSMRLEIIQHGNERDAVDGVQHVLDELGLPLEREMIEQGVAELMRAALTDSRPIAGSVEAVHQLADAGITLGVISNAVFHPFIDWSLDKFGTHGRFRSIVSSASAGYYKSRPELYYYTLEQIGAAPHETLHVGDSYCFDVEGARRAGMRTVWYRTSTHEGDGADADLTVDTLEGLADLLLDRFGRV
jgi:FMN phosphatase YigB (HAD superfamily)